MLSMKLVFQDEIRRVPKIPESFVSLMEKIKNAFKDKLPQIYITNYTLDGGDFKKMACEADFNQLKRSQAQYIKVFVVPTVAPPSLVCSVPDEDRDLDDSRTTTTTTDMLNTTSYSNIPATPSSKELGGELKKDLLSLKERKNSLWAEISRLDEMILELKHSLRDQPTMSEEEKKRLKALKSKLKAQKRKLKDEITLAKEKIMGVKAELEASKGSKKKGKRHGHGHKGKGGKPDHHQVTEIKTWKPSSEEIDEAVSEVIRRLVPLIMNKTIQDIQKKLDAMSGENLNRRTSSVDATGKVIHEGVACDGCGQHPLRGNRFKCSVCDNYDLCERCEKTVAHPHCFIKICDPSKTPRFILVGQRVKRPMFAACPLKRALAQQGLMNQNCPNYPIYALAMKLHERFKMIDLDVLISLVGNNPNLSEEELISLISTEKL